MYDAMRKQSIQQEMFCLLCTFCNSNAVVCTNSDWVANLILKLAVAECLQSFTKLYEIVENTDNICKTFASLFCRCLIKIEIIYIPTASVRKPRFFFLFSICLP